VAHLHQQVIKILVILTTVDVLALGQATNDARACYSLHKMIDGCFNHKSRLGILTKLFAGHAFAGGVNDRLGSGLIDHNQKMTVAAIAMADMKVWAHRS
jgi:hypothetical protein